MQMVGTGESHKCSHKFIRRAWRPDRTSEETDPRYGSPERSGTTNKQCFYNEQYFFLLLSPVARCQAAVCSDG